MCRAASRIWSRRASAYSSCFAAATLGIFLNHDLPVSDYQGNSRPTGWLFIENDRFVALIMAAATVLTTPAPEAEHLEEVLGEPIRASGPEASAPATRKWLVAIAVMLGATMEILDSS